MKHHAPSNFIDCASEWIRAFPVSRDQNSTSRNLKQMLEDVSENHPCFQTKFMEYITTQTTGNKTWKFWCQFVFQDCYAYVCLHLAIRCGRWDLRMAAIKSMAALFTAFDRRNYLKLIPQHIVDVLALPYEILSELTEGGFTSSIRGGRDHNIRIDEAHEMCINKECKEFITRPSADYIRRTAKFLPIRAKAIKKNFESQLFPERKQTLDSNAILSITATTSECKKLEMNVQSQVTKLKQDSTLVYDNHDNTFSHLFNHKKPTPEQIQDLMNFREIGQKEFEHRVQYAILGSPSVTPAKRRKRLLTFTERRVRRKKVSEVEKERRLQIDCWKKRVAFASTTGSNLSSVFQQCIELPRASATSDGNPVKFHQSIRKSV